MRRTITTLLGSFCVYALVACSVQVEGELFGPGSVVPDASASEEEAIELPCDRFTPDTDEAYAEREYPGASEADLLGVRAAARYVEPPSYAPGGGLDLVQVTVWIGPGVARVACGNIDAPAFRSVIFSARGGAR